jgi:hypothetical protein
MESDYIAVWRRFGNFGGNGGVEELMAEVRFLLALEAALMFSEPVWGPAVDVAWPGTDPLGFGVRTVVGALLVLMLFHWLPSVCVGPGRRLPRDWRFGRVLWWVLAGCAVVVAGGYISEWGWMAGGFLVNWREGVSRYAISAGVAGLGFAIAIWRREFASWLLLGFGVLFAVGCLWVQSPGLELRLGQLNETEVYSSQDATDAMVRAGWHVMVIGLRLGLMGLPRRRVFWMGLGSVFLPLVASVTVMSVAKMAGARLFWKASLPIDCTYSIFWLAGSNGDAEPALWPLAAVLVAPLTIGAMWVQMAGSMVRYDAQELCNCLESHSCLRWAPQGWRRRIKRLLFRARAGRTG